MLCGLVQVALLAEAVAAISVYFSLIVTQKGDENVRPMALLALAWGLGAFGFYTFQTVGCAVASLLAIGNGAVLASALRDLSYWGD